MIIDGGFCFSSLCTALRSWLFASASERVVARLRKDLFSHLINQVRSISSRTCKTGMLPVRKKTQNCKGHIETYTMYTHF